MENPSLTTREAAEYLRVSPSFLAKLRCYGGGPLYSKLTGGHRVIYRLSDLNAWRERLLHRSTSEYEVPAKSPPPLRRTGLHREEAAAPAAARLEPAEEPKCGRKVGAEPNARGVSGDE
jgi:hypothetical protein